MTETISPPDTQSPESPHLARPETDPAALRTIQEAADHARERAAMIRQACVTKTHAKVGAGPAGS